VIWPTSKSVISSEESNESTLEVNEGLDFFKDWVEDFENGSCLDVGGPGVWGLEEGLSWSL
jgi:hypothetical protein